MKSRKLWHSFAVIFGYLLLTALLSSAFGSLFKHFRANWIFPFAVGVLFWIGSLIFSLFTEKRPRFALFALPCNLFGASFAIAAYIVGENIAVDFRFLPVLILLLSVAYILFMGILSLPKLPYYVAYVAIGYLLWMTGLILASIYLFPTIFSLLGISLPISYGIFFAIFLTLFAFLAFGTLLPADGFLDLALKLILPSLASTFLVLLIVLLCLAGCDDCDCDGADCCDCDCSNGKYNATSYNKKTQTNATMSTMANP